MRKYQARWWKQIPQARYSGSIVSMGFHGPRLARLRSQPLSRVLAWSELAPYDLRMFIVERAVITVDMPIPIEYSCSIEY